MKQSLLAVCAAILLVAGLVVGNSLSGSFPSLTCGLSAPGICDVRELYRAVEHAPVTDDSEARALILMALGQVRTVNEESARGIDKVYQGADVETSACVRSVLLETINEHASVYITVGDSRRSWDLAVAAASSSSLSEARKNYLSVARSKVGGSADVLLGGSYAARVNNLQHCSSQHEAPIRADAGPQILSSPAPTTVHDDAPVTDTEKLSSFDSLSASSADPSIGHNVARSTSAAGASPRPSNSSGAQAMPDGQRARQATAGNAAAPPIAASSSSTGSLSPESGVSAAPELRKLGPARLAAPAPEQKTAHPRAHPQVRKATPPGKTAKPQNQQQSKSTNNAPKAKANNGKKKAKSQNKAQKDKAKKTKKTKKHPVIKKPKVVKKPPAAKKPHQAKPTKPKKPKQGNAKPKQSKVPPGQQKKKAKAPAKNQNNSENNSKSKPPGQQKKDQGKSQGKKKR